jgi:hypothetical protein
LPNVVDTSSLQAIREAVAKVMSTPGLRNKLGEAVLNRSLLAPKNEIARHTLWAEFKPGPLSLHFGKFCKNVAMELGELHPAPYALTDTQFHAGVGDVLRLKPSVIAAMAG